MKINPIYKEKSNGPERTQKTYSKHNQGDS
jgi:hypothetical protein